MQVDWKKPVQIHIMDTWVDVDVLKVFGNCAVLGRFIGDNEEPSDYSVRVLTSDNNYLRNTPEPPQFIPWTMEELLHHWNSAFRTKGNSNTILRININQCYIGIGGIQVSLHALRDNYEYSDTPWDETSWKPCGKFET